MTAVKRSIALVARADAARSELAGYLRGAGFDVHECEALEVTTGLFALVAVGDQELVANVRSWLRSGRGHRVLVVTSRPTAFKELVASHFERLYILPAPAFGWDVVDALRAGPPARPRGA